MKMIEVGWWAKLNGMLEITRYLIALCQNRKKFDCALLIIKMRVKKNRLRNLRQQTR